MEQKKFTISYGRTINLGNFNSERIEMSQEFDVGEISPMDAFKLVRAETAKMAKAADDERHSKP